MEKISVIMSVYNASKFLNEAIESILNQTYKNFEFIIIDDGSTDNSTQIIEKYKKIDERIVFIENEKNVGLTKNLSYVILKSNKGVACECFNKAIYRGMRSANQGCRAQKRSYPLFPSFGGDTITYTGEAVGSHRS